MFKHALTHDVAYNSLLTSKRKTIHARVGEVIEELYSIRLAEYYEIVAHHYEQGEVWDKAIQFLILSGEKALGNMANPSANTFFQKAIDIASQQSVTLSSVQEYAIYHGKGNTEFNIGRISDAEKDFFKAREAARKMGDQNKEAESLSMAGWSLAAGKKYKEAISVYEEAIDFGRQIGNPVIEGRNLIGKGVLAGALGDVQESGKYIEKAVEIGKRINSPLILTLALGARALGLYHFGTIDEEALEYLNNAISMLRSVQNARACMFIYLFFAAAHAHRGDYMASIKKYQEALKFAEETGELLNRCKGLNTLGWVYSDLGWISEAKKLNEASYKAALEIGSGSEEAEANAIVNLAENAVAEGDFEQAKKYLEGLSKKAETDPGYLFARHRWEVRQLCTLGEISLHKDETDEAMQCAHKAFEIAEKTLNKRGMIKASCLMGEIYITKKDFSKAEETLNEAIANAKEIGNPPQLWRTYYALGKLKEAQGLKQEAKEKYREALKVTERTAWLLTDKKIRDIFLNSDQIVGIRNGLERLQ
jgi:tetratricopeptide (TPR) repeat protein